MTRQRYLTTALLAGMFGVAGYGYYQAQARQAATLARITVLQTCLAASNQQRAQAAKNTVLSISEVVRKNHNPAADIAVLRQAQQILDTTQTLLAKVQQLRQAWQSPDSKPEMGTLPAQVDQYVSYIRQFAPETPPLTKPTAQMAAAGWLGEFDTAAEPRPAALAQLTKLETQVRQVTAEALTYQAQKVGSWCGFDKIGVFATPASETVAPGAVYQAQLALVLAAPNVSRHFSVDGREVPINPATGQGLVQFKVPAAHPGQPDTVRALWHGRVQLPWASADTVLETTVPYFIVKPHSR